MDNFQESIYTKRTPGGRRPIFEGFFGKTNWSMLLKIIFFAAIVGALAAYLILNQSFPKHEIISLEEVEEEMRRKNNPDPKTFRNNKYGFTFEYPWQPKECLSCRETFTDEAFNLGGASFVIEDLGEADLKEFVDEKIKNFKVERMGEGIMAGQDSIAVEHRLRVMPEYGFDYKGGISKAIFFAKDDKVFGFFLNTARFCCESEEGGAYETEVYESMIKTFKFSE